MNSMLLDELIEYAGKENVLVSEKLKDHTTFKVGGPCTALVQVSSSEIFSKVLKCLEKEKEPYFVIGNGSNLLVSDNGFQGVVLKLTGDFLKVSVEGNRIVAGAGAMVIKVCNDALNNSLSGLEFAYGIPGTVGGAMVMNAGAYDGEMSMVVEKVQLMDKEGKSFSLSCEEMEFGYRDSILNSGQSASIPDPIFFIELGIVIDSKLEQFEKAPFPISVTELGIVYDSIFSQL